MQTNWSKFNIVEDAGTEVRDIIKEEEDEAVSYDLSGRPVDASYKGISIRNGKKHFIP